MATRYVDAVFAATHNSYSPGRGALRRQLDGGVRCLELDFNLADGRYELATCTPATPSTRATATRMTSPSRAGSA